MREIILANQGEMALKGLNRATFESVLMKTMRRRLSTVGEFKVYRAQSTMMRNRWTKIRTWMRRLTAFPKFSALPPFPGRRFAKKILK